MWNAEECTTETKGSVGNVVKMLNVKVASTCKSSSSSYVAAPQVLDSTPTTHPTVLTVSRPLDTGHLALVFTGFILQRSNTHMGINGHYITTENTTMTREEGNQHSITFDRLSLTLLSQSHFLWKVESISKALCLCSLPSSYFAQRGSWILSIKSKGAERRVFTIDMSTLL